MLLAFPMWEEKDDRPGYKSIIETAMRYCSVLARDKISSSILPSTPWATAQHSPEHPRKDDPGCRTCGFLKKQNQGSSWQQILIECSLCVRHSSRHRSSQLTQLFLIRLSLCCAGKGTELQGTNSSRPGTWMVSGWVGIWTRTVRPQNLILTHCVLFLPHGMICGLKKWMDNKSITHVCGHK